MERIAIYQIPVINYANATHFINARKSKIDQNTDQNCTTQTQSQRQVIATNDRN